MTEAQTLTFSKVSKVDRFQEPVTVSVPFAQGAIDDPLKFVIRDGDRSLSLQRRVLARWPDASVKWLLVHFQVDLPGNAGHSLSYEILEQPAKQPEPACRVVVRHDENGVRVDTGVLSLVIPSTGFLPLSGVALDGESLWADSPFQGFHLQLGEQSVSTTTCPVELEIEEAGPLRAVVNVSGKHCTPQGEPYLDLRGRIVAYAGKPYVEVEYGFFHCEEEDSLDLHQVQLPIDLAGTQDAQLSLGEGYYRTRIQQSTEQVGMSLTRETLLYQSYEHFVECFYGDFWVDWRTEKRGLAVSIHQAHQNFPKSLCATPAGIDVGIYPRTAPPPRSGKVSARHIACSCTFTTERLPWTRFRSRACSSNCQTVRPYSPSGSSRTTPGSWTSFQSTSRVAS